MAIGAVGVYFIAIIANDNDSLKQQKYQQALTEYQTKVAAQTKALSDTYYPIFSPYASRVGAFDKAPAQEKLVTQDLQEGDGAVIDDTTVFAAYYIGWNPDGTVFDQSLSSGALKAPISISTGLGNASLIQGWKDGMKGMKVGGIRELTIPSPLAYGSTGSGSDIPADTPIKFVVMAIPPPEQVAVPTELLSQ